MSNSSILLVGNGRVASHLSEYFRLASISYSVWHRRQNQTFEDAVFGKNCVLLAIADNSLGAFIELHRDELQTKRVIHFSGALCFDDAIGVHPLMTFAKTTYPLELYQRIPMAIDRPDLSVNSLIEGLQNPSFYIPREKKALYHALCSFSGNLTQLLWQLTRDEFERELGLGSELLNPYLEQVYANLIHLKAPLTGPLARRDFEIVNLHLKVLPRELSQIYQSFVSAYLKKEINNESRSL